MTLSDWRVNAEVVNIEVESIERRLLLKTPKALTNVSPGLEQPWGRKQQKSSTLKALVSAAAS